MKGLGFSVTGTIRPDPDEIDKAPDMSAEWQQALIQRNLSSDDAFDHLTHDQAFYEAWGNFYWNMCLYMGVDLQKRYTHEALRRYTKTLPNITLQDSPTNICWFLHGLSAKGGSRNFLNEWANEYHFPIIFNIRDPRDILISYIDYLQRKTKYGFGNYSDYLIYSKILDSMDSYKEKLTFAIEDPLFPGKELMRDSLWLCRHPDVLVVRYEDLVGKSGGETNERQHQTINAMENYTGRRYTEPSNIYNKGSFTFNTGLAGRWRGIFDDELQEKFNQLHGYELRTLGYSD
jgi:hypothetical protein